MDKHYMYWLDDYIIPTTRTVLEEEDYIEPTGILDKNGNLILKQKIKYPIGFVPCN